MTNWQTIKFGDLLAEPTRNGIYKPKEFHGHGSKMINMGELFAHPRIQSVEMRRVDLTEKEGQRFSVQDGDLLFARRSLVAEGAGKCSIVLKIDEPTAFESSIIRARLDTHVSHPLFYFYFFSSPQGQHALDTIRRQVAVAGITGSDLVQLSVPAPPLVFQKSVADLLGSLDDKTELNRRMNETLEAMAQAIFRDWFLDFGPTRRKADGASDPVTIMGGLVIDPKRAQELAELFPARLGDDGLPEGWQQKRLEEIARQHTEALTPSLYPDEVFAHYSIPAFDKEQRPSLEAGAAIRSNKTMVPQDAVLLSKLNPEISRVWLPDQSADPRAISSTEFLAYTTREPFSRVGAQRGLWRRRGIRTGRQLDERAGHFRHRRGRGYVSLPEFACRRRPSARLEAIQASISVSR